MKISYRIRDRKNEDTAFIIDSWVKDRRLENDWLDYATYRKLYADYVKRMMQQSDISVMCSGNDEDYIIGYIARRKGKVLQSYIKRGYRNPTIQKALEDV